MPLWVDRLEKGSPSEWLQLHGAWFGKQTAFQEENSPFAPGHTGWQAEWHLGFCPKWPPPAGGFV